MTEIETYARTGARTYTVKGGARDTTYDNLAQAIRRMRNLAKQGKYLNGLHFDAEKDRYEFVFGIGHPISRTPGYQHITRGKSRDGRATICLYATRDFWPDAVIFA